MSQAKVDRYKKEKANRKKIMKKEKRLLFLEKAAGCLLGAAIIFWAGYSIYDYSQNAGSETTETITTEVNLDSLYDYYATLQ